MATQHYNLPTFDGAQADQPINFKTGMTDAFTKIDTQMYANATGIEGKADEADLSTLETMVEAMSARIDNLTQGLTFQEISGISTNLPCVSYGNMIGLKDNNMAIVKEGIRFNDAQTSAENYLLDNSRPLNRISSIDSNVFNLPVATINSNIITGNYFTLAFANLSYYKPISTPYSEYVNVYVIWDGTNTWLLTLQRYCKNNNYLSFNTSFAYAGITPVPPTE